MKGTLKRPMNDETSVDSAPEKPKPHHTTTEIITVEDYLNCEDDIFAGWSMYDDETVEELRKFLELEEHVDEEAEKKQGHQRVQSDPFPSAVKLISNPYSSQSRPLILSSVPYITTNGNVESCGSSISDSDSSVMASVHMATFDYNNLNPQMFLGVSGDGTVAGYTSGSADDEMTRGWLVEEDVVLQKNVEQAVVGGARRLEEEAVRGMYIENGNKNSEGSNGASEYDCLAWDDEALARFIGEENEDQGVDRMVFD